MLVVLALLVGMAVAGGIGSVAMGQSGDAMMMVVNDLPFDRVWRAAQGALASLGVTREDPERGVVVVESEWAAQGVERMVYDRVREIVTVRLERIDPLSTKLTVTVGVSKRKGDGSWVPDAPPKGAEQMILTAVSERLRGRR